MATDKSRGLDLNGIESLEPMILMSASAADIDAATLDDATEGNDVMIALEAGGLMDGKAGHDILIGLAGDNYLKGGDGHDMLISVRGDNVIDGGDGHDVVVYWGGDRADYKVTDKGFGILEIDNGRSTDFVTNVEEIQFRDGSYSISDLFKSGAVPLETSSLVTDATDLTVSDVVVSAPVVAVTNAVDSGVTDDESTEVMMTELPVAPYVTDDGAANDVVIYETVSDADIEAAQDTEIAQQDVAVEDAPADDSADVETSKSDTTAPMTDADIEAAQDTDENAAVEEEFTQSDVSGAGDDEVWACVNQWMSHCNSGSEPVDGPSYEEHEEPVVDEIIDCVTEPPVEEPPVEEPPVEEPPVEEPPVVCEVEPPVVSVCNETSYTNDFNWCFTPPSYVDCNLVKWCEPVLTNCFTAVSQLCDFSQSFNTCDYSHSSNSNYSHHNSGWSWGGWSNC